MKLGKRRTLQKILIILAAYIVLELIVLNLLAKWLGGSGVFLILAGTALLGGMVVRTRGRRAWEEMRLKLNAGEPPGHAMLNGLCILAGGLLLVLPGIIGDLAGLTLLLPLTRGLYRAALYRLLERIFRGGGTSFFRIGRR